MVFWHNRYNQNYTDRYLDEIFILIFVALLSLNASEIRFEHDFHKALQKASKQNKEVMMYSAVCSQMLY